MGLPDDGQVRVRRGAGLTGVSVTYPGTADFLGDMPADIQEWPRLLLPLPDARLEVPRLPVINHMGDADRYRQALEQATRVIERLGMPCFNHPAAVLRTTRDGMSTLLAGIPGVLMPQTIRISPRSVKDFPRAVAEHGLRYPVIARLTGTQSGRTQTRVERAEDWDQVHGISWREREAYLTQYMDCRDPDGLYRKQRIVFVGGRPLPNALQAGTNWSMHGADRLPEHWPSEIAWLETFETAALPPLQERLTEIARRVGLDLFGIDFALKRDGSMVVFEANAAMSMISLSILNKLPHLAACRYAIRDELVALLRDPARWLCAPAEVV